MSAALALRGVDPRERMRISLLLSSFEAGMPLVGLLLGRAAGHAIGAVADYLAIAVLALVAVWMLVAGEEAEERRVAGLTQARGLALVALGLSVSVDELAMGFSLGLLHVPVWLAIVLFAAQAFLVAQLGMRLGARGGEALRESAERAAALALLALAAVLLAEKLAQ